MRVLLILGSCWLLCPTLFGSEVIRELSWRELDNQGRLTGGELVIDDDPSMAEAIRIENTETREKTTRVLIIEEPGISETVYAITGQVRYGEVEGDGYLEMWSYIPGRGRFYSRTRSDSGPTGKLHGTSGWRPFILPFYRSKDGPTPDKLIFNVVLPGRGSVWLSPLRLEQFKPGEDPLVVPGQWWGGRSAGLIGGITGSLLGLMGGLVGILAGRGRARRTVFGLLVILRISGICTLLAGAIAVIQSQPYGVYYPLLLLGGIVTAISWGISGSIRRRYEDLELRKIKAMDAS